MSWSEMEEEGGDPIPHGVISQEEHAEAGQGFYPEDCGELQLDTRRALVKLLSGPALEGRRHGKLWPVLVRDEQIIRRRLADMFLKLVIDHDAQVAFTQQADTGDLETPMLLRRAHLTFIDSILLLELRRRLTASDVRGERAVISLDEIVEAMIAYERAESTDRAGFNKRIRASIEKFKERNILQKIRSSDDRFEVSPTLKLLFSADRIHALHKLYQDMAAGDQAVAIVNDADETFEQESDL